MGNQVHDDRPVVEAFDLNKATSPETVARIRELIQKRGLAISSLAKIAELSPDRVQRYFKTPGKATVNDFCSICRALGVTPNEANGDKTVIVG